MAKKNILQRIKNLVPVKLKSFLKKIALPGFEGLPLYQVIRFIVDSISKGAATVRASSIAYNLFLAIFPALIFFFSLIAYLPFSNLPDELMKLLRDVMPTNAYLSIQGTIMDIITHKRTGLLSIGFIMTLYFSTNGLDSMISAFNESYFETDKRSWIQRRGISVVLVFILTLLVTVSIVLLISSQWFFGYLLETGILEKDLTYYLIIIGKWVVIISLIFFAISFLYYLAPARKSKYKFISAGSSVATLLTLLLSIGFSYYVNHFGQYNKIYGSLGTLIVLLVWLYLNSLVLIIGFELNAVLRKTKANKDQFNLLAGNEK
jgi:membrane protein